MYFKRKTAIGILLIVAMVFALAGCGGDGGETGEVYELSLSTHDPAGSGNTVYQQAWADEIKEASGGRINITIYPGGTLAASADALDAVKTGACDIAWIFTGFYANQFPLTDVATLPLLGIESATQATDALWDMYETSEQLQAELNAQFKPLMVYTNNPNYIGTAGKPVEKLADVEGLKLRASAGTATEMVTAWKGTPISMGPSDMYQSLEKGVINGYVFEYSGIGSYNLVEVTDSYLELPICVGPFMLAMNTETWNSLPEDLQQIIMDCSDRETSRGAAEVFEEDAASTVEEIKAAGADIIVPDDATKAEFQVAADAYNETWAAKNSADGFDGAEYLQNFKDAVMKYAE